MTLCEVTQGTVKFQKKKYPAGSQVEVDDKTLQKLSAYLKPVVVKKPEPVVPSKVKPVKKETEELKLNIEEEDGKATN